MTYSKVYVNNELQQAMNEMEKLKSMYICDLVQGITQIHKKPLPEIFDEYSHGTTKLDVSQLTQLFANYSATPFLNSAKEAVKLIFPEAKNESEFVIADIEKLFHGKIKLEVSIQGYFAVGIEIARTKSNTAEKNLTILFKTYDKDQKNSLNYKEFEQMMKEHKNAEWKTFALYDEMRTKDEIVTYNDFFFNLLFNISLQHFFE